jgi:hypothetical protein
VFTRADAHCIQQRLLAAIAETPDLAIVGEAERVLAIVNEVRAERGSDPARLSQVVALHEKVSGMPDPVRAYALQCALLALNPTFARTV